MEENLLDTGCGHTYKCDCNRPASKPGAAGHLPRLTRVGLGAEAVSILSY